LLWNSILHVSFFASIALLSSPTLFAQSTGGRIRGTVTDQSGATVTAAKVVITNQANGSQRDTETGTNGEYMFLEVPVGTYEIEINQTGFKKYLRKGIAVDLNQILTVDVILQVGTATETIEVTGAPPWWIRLRHSWVRWLESAPSVNCRWHSAIPISCCSFNRACSRNSASTIFMAAIAPV
jgi:hypothetical protein